MIKLSIFTPLEEVLLGFVALLLASGTVLGFMYHRAQNQTRVAALHADSLAAALDTSHAIALTSRDSVRILGDSIQAVGRRVFQVPQTNDALDKALNQQRTAIANLTAQVKQLAAHVTSVQPVTTDAATGARSTTFKVDTTPYHGTAAVSLPVTGSGTLDLRLTIDRAAIGLRLGCGAKTDGIRSASATMTGPPWLSLELGRVEQSAEVCNPAPSRPGFLHRLLSSCGIGPSYGPVLVTGKIVFAPGAAASCHAWP